MNLLRYIKGVPEDEINKKYKKVQQCIAMLEGSGDAKLVDAMIGEGYLEPFMVGKNIKVDKDEITIGHRKMDIRDIRKVCINREGSMSLYDRYGRKVCGTFTVNCMMENIELLCWCLHHYGAEVQVKSGRGERVYQNIVLAVVIIAYIMFRILRLH